MALSSLLPAPSQHIQDRDDDEREYRQRVAESKQQAMVVTGRRVAPPYGHRKGWVPRSQEDFCDGGAYPEIHVAQYPLSMGQSKTTSNALPAQLNAEGKINYDVLAKQGHGKDKVVHSKFTDMVPKAQEDDAEITRPDEETIEDITEKTRLALEKLVNSKISAAMPVKRAEKTAPAQYVRYTPSQQGMAFNSGAKQRIIRMVEVQKDPMEPPRFKTNKKIPRGPPSPPAPVLHSPNRKVTVKEQQEWKIPPCISNWKNAKGYTIPLDKRLAADGRGLQGVHINENFAKLAEALYIADRKAREAVEMRAQIEKKHAQKLKDKKEQDLRMLAQKARDERAGIRRVGEQDDEAEEREDIRRDRAKDRKRERNLQRAGADKRNKLQKEHERDISEKIALGVPSQGVSGGSSEGQFDQRLFNRSKGMDSGFGAEDSYNVYDKPWREDRDAANAIYRPSKNIDQDIYGGDLDKLMKQKRFVADKGFAGADATRRLDGPVGFVRDEKEEEDPFGLNKFLSAAKQAQKRPAESGSSRDHERKHKRRE